MHKRLMAMKQSLAAAIESQLCNLGEADAELLFRTTTNPKYRKLLKINIKDLENGIINEVFK